MNRSKDARLGHQKHLQVKDILLLMEEVIKWWVHKCVSIEPAEQFSTQRFIPPESQLY